MWVLMTTMLLRIINASECAGLDDDNVAMISMSSIRPFEFSYEIQSQDFLIEVSVLIMWSWAWQPCRPCLSLYHMTYINTDKHTNTCNTLTPIRVKKCVTITKGGAFIEPCAATSDFLTSHLAT